MATVPSLTRLCTLGSGATATVSLASDLDSGRFYAIKWAELSHASPLQHEHRILSSLSSPHIISCHGSYTSNSHFHLLLEFASGGSLFDIIKSHTEGRLDESDIRSYARDILLGLSYLHANSISHGDIKSQNILIGSDGWAKIADFGTAMQTGATWDEKPGPLLGTPSFMAPEVARGEERSPAADIWALGCTIIEMATGKAPWHGTIKDQDIVSAVYRIGYCSDSIPETPNWLSEEGKDFLMNCLKRDPNERWSAEKLLNHPFVRLSEAGLERDGSKVSTFSPQSALDFGLVFHDSETEDEAEEEEMGLDATERMRELAGFRFGSRLLDWDPNEEGWVEVRSSSNGGENVADGNGECENGDQIEFLDYGDDTDSAVSSLSFNFVDVSDRINEEADCLVQPNYEFDVCKVNLINEAVNSRFDQNINPFSLFLLVYLTFLFVYFLLSYPYLLSELFVYLKCYQ